MQIKVSIFERTRRDQDAGVQGCRDVGGAEIEGMLGCSGCRHVGVQGCGVAGM